ncbi:unnamed protein product [Hymenolepis diminuta]|uniref:PGG domain-containing protein n=1 Tax=Hymenolepis diminuta TaxID=6216 RepID=A0A0R3SP38_HYMDI|nr:unnamed protein product [Hymenolepis diminuta]
MGMDRRSNLAKMVFIILYLMVPTVDLHALLSPVYPKLDALRSSKVCTFRWFYKGNDGLLFLCAFLISILTFNVVH